MRGIWGGGGNGCTCVFRGVLVKVQNHQRVDDNPPAESHKHGRADKKIDEHRGL